MAKNELSGSLVTVLLLAIGAGYWYCAQHMAWLTFAAAYAGVTLGWAFVKEIIKEARK